MTFPHDMSIGRRLLIGFGLLMLLLAVLIGLVFHWEARSAKAQDEVARRIMPYGERVNALERSLLRVAIGVRSYLVNPDAGRLQRYRAQANAAREALRRLEQQIDDPNSEAVYRKLKPLIVQYLRETDTVVARRAAGPIDAAEEQSLARKREISAAALQEFTDLQDQRLAAALAAMAAARNGTSDGLMIMSILAALLFLVLAYFTARSVRQPTRALLQIALALKAGDWKPALAWAPARDAHGNEPPAPRNEMLRIARGFGAAAASLQRRDQRVQADARIAAAMASSLQRDAVAAAALHDIVQYLGAELGIVYWRGPGSDTLEPAACLGLSGQAGVLHVGEDIPGCAARDQRLVVTKDIPSATRFRIKRGHDEFLPQTLAAAPVVFRGEVQGVLLVAALRHLDDEALAFLTAAGLQLGVGFQNVRAYDEVERLLADVREKSERIQAQNEELQLQNEEIQAQSEELQAQSEEIQSQNEELRRHAVELRAQAAVLAETNERKNEFLGILAHELRNPMAAITNSLTITQRAAPGSEPARRAHAVIERQTQHLIRLIDDLLDITRISRGKIVIQRERLNLVDVAHTCVEDQRPVFEAAGLTIDLDLPGTPVWVDGDRTRLSQVVGNLLNNAIKFTDRGQRVAVALRPRTDARQAALHVIDSGIGIDSKLLPQLFQPFTQGATNLARTHGGLGLGLALVKALVELHGGSVEARSDGLGKGAEFIVQLPLQEHCADEVAPERRAPDSARRRILIIEDNADVAESLREIMQMEGHEVQVATSGTEGLEKARHFQPRVVLCDIGLPTMNGYEVVQRFRADERLREVCFVALTGYTTEVDKQRAAQSGFDFHLPKPPSVERIKEILAQIG